MVGHSDAINDAIMALKENGLVLKVVKGLQDNFSTKVWFSLHKERVWLGQLHLIDSSERKFSDQLNKVHNHKMLGTPTFFNC